MINIKKYIINLELVKLKLKVPQVGSFILPYINLSDIPNGNIYDFIINIDGDLLIGKGHYKLNNKNDTLYFAGRLKINNGKIYYIDNDSGHYIPTKTQTENITRILEEYNLFI